MMHPPSHDTASAIAREQVAWWRSHGYAPFECLRLLGLPAVSDRSGMACGWDDVREAVARIALHGTVTAPEP